MYIYAIQFLIISETMVRSQKRITYYFPSQFRLQYGTVTFINLFLVIGYPMDL